MNFTRFSPDAFESLAGDPVAARHLSDQLQDAVLAALAPIIEERFQAIVFALNACGHRLAPCGEQTAGEGDFRDYTDPACCALRLGFDLVISAGYKDSRHEGGWGEMAEEEESP